MEAGRSVGGQEAVSVQLISPTGAAATVPVELADAGTRFRCSHWAAPPSADCPASACIGPAADATKAGVSLSGTECLGIDLAALDQLAAYLHASKLPFPNERVQGQYLYWQRG